MKKTITFGLTLLLASCATTRSGRVFLDSTTHRDNPPDWVDRTRTVWEKDGRIYLKASHTVRGDERVNGCFDLARLDSKERILSEIANDVKGSLDNAQQSISESAEVVLGKVRSGQFDGRLSGLRFSEEYYERYRIGEQERVDCHVLGEIRETDYNAVKKSILERVVAVDPRLKEAITKKQIDFFSTRPGQDSEPAPRETASENEN